MKAIRFLTAILISIALAACGGGGGGGGGTATTYSISGTVTSGGVAKSGVTVNLTGASAGTATTDASGNYSFAGLANGYYTVTPSQAGFAFTPSSKAVTVSGANVTAQNFTATAAAATYGISGSAGIANATITVTSTGGGSGTAVSGSTGAYTIAGLVPATYTVTPTLTGYTFAPASATATITNANVMVPNFVATAIPVAHNLTGTVTSGGTGLAGVTMTVTGTGAPAPVTTSASGAYTVSLYDGAYTVTPSLTGYTFSPISASVTMAGAANTQNFTATANASVMATVNGTVTGPWVSGVTITVSGGGATGTTTTNATGNYSFNLPSGQTYTFTASLAGYTFTTGTATIPAGSSAAVNATAITGTSAIASNTITGTISYAGTKTGTVFVRVSCTTGCAPVAGAHVALTGTAGAYTGTYTIRGVQNNTYTVKAEMDTVGNGQPNAANPAASLSLGAITASATANLTLVDPATPVPVTPTLKALTPSNGAVAVKYTTPVNASNQEIADHYKIYWGTDAAASTGTPITIPAPGLNGNNLYIMGGLTAGATYYFRVSALVGAVESAATAIQSAVASAPTGGNTVSGTVTWSGTATGPLVAVVGGNGTPYFTIIGSKAAPPTSPASFTITGVPAGSYQTYAIIDMNNNGVIDLGDIHNTGGNGVPVTVAGTVTGDNVTLSTANSTANITTVLNSGTWGSNYSIRTSNANGMKRVIGATVYSGPNIPVPFDMGDESTNGNENWVYTAATPAIGDTYLFKVDYSDGTSANLSASVTGVLTAASLPTALTVTPAAGSTAPTFSWTAGAAPTLTPATYSMWISGGATNWWMGGISALSVVYNANGNASTATLATGVLYNWSVSMNDAKGNSAQTNASFTN